MNARTFWTLRAAVVGTLMLAVAGSRAADPVAPDGLSAGRRLVLTGHCNNCHTADYAMKAGQVPEAQWLMGNPVGWRGGEGTVYASNLRLVMQAISEDDWLRVARSAQWRAPMPWWSVREYDDAELRAIYRYIRSLMPSGSPAPAFLPAGQTPPGVYNVLPECAIPGRCR